jgi:RHS repeat-associated protein
VNPANISGNRVILSKASGAVLFYALYLSDGKLAFAASSDGTWTTPIMSATAISTGTWTHVAAVRNGTTVSLYVNGTAVQQGTFASTVFDSSMNLSCGALDGGANAFAGYIDDVRISNTDRSASFNTSSTTYTYNNANQLTTEQSGLQTKTYTYDPNGNNTAVTTTVSSTNKGNVTMSYDSLNRMINWSDGINSEATAYRGAAWHRTSTTINGGNPTTYLYDGDNVISDCRMNEMLSMKHFYVTPALDENISITTSTPIGQSVGGGTTTYIFGEKWKYFYTQDGLGSVRTLTNDSGEIGNKYDYHAFGEKNNLNSVELTSNRYTYTGRETSRFSNAPMYYRYRFTDNNGIFLGRDPFGYNRGDFLGNLYRYCENNPIKYKDSFGLMPEENEKAEIILREFNIKNVNQVQIYNALKAHCPDKNVLTSNSTQCCTPENCLTQASVLATNISQAIYDLRKKYIDKIGKISSGNWGNEWGTAPDCADWATEIFSTAKMNVVVWQKHKKNCFTFSRIRSWSSTEVVNKKRKKYWMHNFVGVHGPNTNIPAIFNADFYLDAWLTGGEKVVYEKNVHDEKYFPKENGSGHFAPWGMVIVID